MKEHLLTLYNTFANNLISEPDLWMSMINTRNITSHTYNTETASEVVNAILDIYIKLFIEFEVKMTHLQEQNNI